MVLTIDANAIAAAKFNITKEKINKNDLKRIENDLDIDEKISILFLMIEDYTLAFDEVFHLYNKLKKGQAYILSEFVDNHLDNWQERLLEAICIIQNWQIVRKLGITQEHVELIYIPRIRLCTKHLNRVVKCLYMLCEAMTDTQIKSLLTDIKGDATAYEKDLDNVDCLELHMLYWMKTKYISIFPVDLKNLMKHVKLFDDLELIYLDLKKCESQQNVLDTHNVPLLCPTQPQNFSVGENVHVIEHSKDECVRKIKKGLCIIISQMFFAGQKYETRFGTTTDSAKLKETFSGFGFDIFVCENFTKDELIAKIHKIPEEFGTSYDCIFLCILSHGSKGSIICSDEEEVTIDTIEHTMCCVELRDVIKVVIIQACQGKMAGQIDATLSADGPITSNNANIAAYKNFCVFMSTMQGFVSVRHKREGSWFIQELCNVLQSEGSHITFTETVRNIMKSVEKKRGVLDGTDSVAQLPELRPYRLLQDFQLPIYRRQNR